MIWKVLGIEPTKDKKAITAAYRTRLAHTNPEDRPEEFKELRAAYEQALKLADQHDTPAAAETPLDVWAGRIRTLYDDYAARISPKSWEELLYDDVCQALDTRPLAEEALLRFLMQDFYLPQAVWQVLDRAFLWSQRADQLYETFPRDFVDYAVLNGIRYPENLPYELFTPGSSAADCDEYRRLYYRIGQADPEEQERLLGQINDLSESHPYGTLLACHQMLKNGETEKAAEGCRMLAEQYPEDAKLQLEWAARCMEAQNWSEGETYARRSLQLRSDSQQAKYMLSTCLANQEKYDDAKALIFELMDDAGGNQKRIAELRQTLQQFNEALISDLEGRLQNDPADDISAAKLAWCYLQNERSEDALRLCQNISSDYQDRYDYHNLYAKAAFSVGDYELALTHLQQTLVILQDLKQSGGQDDDRIASIPEKLQMQGSCLIQMGQNEEALKKYEQALSLAPEDPEVLTRMGHLLYSLNDNRRAAEIFETLTKLLPGSYHGHYMLALVLFYLDNDRDAFAAVNRALELEGGDLGVYLLKMRILLRNGAWEGVRSTLDFLHQHGITDEITTVWCEAQLLEWGENNKEQALDLYRSIAQRIEAGEMLEEACRLYYRLLILEAEHLDAGKSEDRAKMLALAEKGLSYNPDDFACLDYKAWLLKRDGKRNQALEIYHRLESVSRRTQDVERELAELYYQDLDRDADKALHYYQMLIRQEPLPEYLFYAGTCCRYLGRYDEGEQYFLRLQELSPDGIDGYNGLSYLYDVMKRYEESVEQIDKVIERARKREGNQSHYYYHKVRNLRRLNRPLDAMAVIDELSDAYGNDDRYLEKFEICCQFGLWDLAEQILKQWKKDKKKTARLTAALIDLDIFIGRLDKAGFALKLHRKKLNAGDAERLELLMAELDGIESVQMSIWEKRAASRQDQTHELMNMAQVQWWNGHYENARMYAQKALEQIDRLLPTKKKYEALYRSRRSLALAVLGRFDEAEAELAAVRLLPLCEHCNYCSCKDADIFEANIEEIRGNYEKAMRLHSAGAERWHDDMDFLSGVRRVMRKGY